MFRITRFSGFFSAAMFVIVLVILSPSFQSEAIRSSHRFSFRKAPPFRNAAECGSISGETTTVCDPSLVHVAITLDVDYLRGSIAAVHSILHNSLCPENIFFHFLVSDTNLQTLVESTFPNLKFNVYYFDPNIVAHLISSSVRQALEQPLNYARNYLVDLLESCVERVIYLDSDLVVVDDVAKLWSASLDSRAIGAKNAYSRGCRGRSRSGGRATSTRG
ncbi:Putative galacturonosyltransferase-like 7 [Glycine soja]|nr:Putative galacturonosyltransferase-like 7 [Glycine soja]